MPKLTQIKSEWAKVKPDVTNAKAMFPAERREWVRTADHTSEESKVLCTKKF